MVHTPFRSDAPSFRMLNWFLYDFGYTWIYTRGHFLVFLACAVLSSLCFWRGWRRWAMAASIVAAWGLGGAFIVNHVLQLTEPQRIPTDAFLSAGRGRVLDLGAGSGRAAVGLLLARPQATVTALDIYQGYYGIDDNTPDRLLRNARVAGVDGRVEVRVGDMRQLPFGAGEFDAAMSVAAMDHLRWEGVEQALRETARVLKPDGQLLIVSLNVDHLVMIAMPVAMHGHGYWGTSQDRDRWRAALARSGFDVSRIGTRPATLYILAQKR